ncbi:MAG: hypothetical protein JO287_25715 [Pseudonocardiales bacterium]|nr:hypothetical protein [Pseudonocardiales bacterium]
MSITYTVAGKPAARILWPASGRIYVQGQSVATSFSCVEGLGGPGLAACADSTGTHSVRGGRGRLDTSTPRRHTYAVTAISRDSQRATATIAYTVRAAGARLVIRPPAVARAIAAPRCTVTPFQVSVRGQSIVAVAFRLDGRRLAADAGHPFAVLVWVSGGRHRLTARVSFLPGSRVKPRRLPLRFTGCSTPPPFTG